MDLPSPTNKFRIRFLPTELLSELFKQMARYLLFHRRSHVALDLIRSSIMVVEYVVTCCASVFLGDPKFIDPKPASCRRGYIFPSARGWTQSYLFPDSWESDNRELCDDSLVWACTKGKGPKRHSTSLATSQVLGGGLMIYFRHPNVNIGLVVMFQILIAFSYGALVICQQMAVMAVAAHNDIAVQLALLISTSVVGSGIGTTISGAIWTNTMLEQLVNQLPDYAKANATQIYGDLSTQLSYSFGDSVRTAIIEAYGVTQQRMCIASTAVMAVGLIAVLMWKEVNLKEMVQVKGVVF